MKESQDGTSIPDWIPAEDYARLLGDAERERHGIIFVAYARPLERW